MGVTGMNLQPMDRWTPETYDELWIEEDEHANLQKIVDTLIAMKRQGEPIVNSELLLSLLVPHFREEKAPPDVMPCRVGLRDFFIRTNGDIEVCFFYPPIGNIKDNSARDIWYGPKAEDIRRQTVECDRLCLYTCLSQKTLKDKFKMGLMLLKPHSKNSPNDDLVETIAPAGSR
jgi:MoaA/NifB/PqqE/SkfB family radical SAM enzyme